ncbi:MAG TPA: L-threonylcarbamoyladenylate synthase, partial [Burkholderiales bacterium]|nr:L-threonylcarbamoyladenylate synthase [Burkholderiales bacterium]
MAILRRGGLVAFPTETVYGLGADASNPAAVARIYEVKGRPAGHPVIVHIGDIGQLARWARDIPEAATKLATHFWPGPLTLVLRRAPGVGSQLSGGQDTIGLRVPGHPVALQLLREFGGGIAAPSANRFGRISPTAAEHVRSDLASEVELILDGGACEIGIESTIVDLSRGRPVLLRPG